MNGVLSFSSSATPPLLLKRWRIALNYSPPKRCWMATKSRRVPNAKQDVAAPSTSPFKAFRNCWCYVSFATIDRSMCVMSFALVYSGGQLTLVAMVPVFQIHHLSIGNLSSEEDFYPCSFFPSACHKISRDNPGATDKGRLMGVFWLE